MRTSLSSQLSTSGTSRSLQQLCKGAKKAHDLDECGYGMIVNNEILTHQKTSPLDLVLKNDDVELLKLLLGYFFIEKDILAFMAKRYRARRCQRAISQLP